MAGNENPMQNPLDPTNRVIVVGAGWSGLAASLALARAGKQVCLLEAAPQAGGRARGVLYKPGQDSSLINEQLNIQNTWIDNGQHILIGAYQGMHTMLDWLDCRFEDYFARCSFEVHVEKTPGKPAFLLKSLNCLPSPFHLLAGILLPGFKLNNLTLKEKYYFIRAMRFFNAKTFPLEQDISVLALLTQLKQPASLIRSFWAPITIAALTTPIEKASAQILFNILKLTFTGKKSNSDFWFPKKNLSELFPIPAVDYLRKHGHFVAYRHRVKELIIEQNRCVGVIYQDKNSQVKCLAEKVILATPAWVTANLLSPIQSCNTIAAQLNNLSYQPIITVYLFFKNPIKLVFPLIGFETPLVPHWIIDQNISHHPNRLACILSGEGEYIDWSKEKLLSTILNSLQNTQNSCFQDNPLLDYKIICEKKAAFSCNVDITQQRPSAQTPIDGLILAGNSVQNGLPASLEGAIQNGFNAAGFI